MSTEPASPHAGEDHEPAKAPPFKPDVEGWCAHLPVLDASDLYHIADLPDPGDDPETDAFSLLTGDAEDLTRFRRRMEQQQERQWVRQARLLAGLGVRVAPSHREASGRLLRSTRGAYDYYEFLHYKLTQQEPSRYRAGEPLLIYGKIVDPENPVIPDFAGRWFRMYALAAQTAGRACRQTCIVGMPLSLSQQGRRAAAAIVDFPNRAGHDCVGVFKLSLTELSEYHQLLARFDLHADGSWEHLQEGLYPIDRACAPLLTEDLVPDYSDLWVDDPQTDALGRLARLGEELEEAPRWHLMLLTENCD